VPGHRSGRHRRAFLGFHAAMLSNRATAVILMPFGVALVISLLASFALRDRAR
jgi:hypothetical protein